VIDKFAEFTEMEFPLPETLFDDYANRGTASKTAEMNLLTHMQYGHDSKVKPETIEEMAGVVPEVPEFKDGYYGPYNRSNEEQKSQYEPTLDRINEYFRANWPTMSDEDKMKWKYQRYYMQTTWPASPR